MDRAAAVLEKHHSRSVLPQRHRLATGQRVAAMATVRYWKCKACKQQCRLSAVFCSSCGGHWQQMQEVPYHPAPTWAPTPQPWHGQGGWESPRQRTPHSPRRRQGKSQPSGGKGQKGKHQTEPGKGQTKSRLPEEEPEKWPALPSLAAVPAAPKAALPTKSAPAAPPVAANPDSQRLIADLLSLIPQEQLTPELQRRAGQVSVDETKKQGKLMHKMVSEQTQAKKELETLRANRAAFSSAWETYVLQLLEMWKQQGEERMAALDTFAEKEAELTIRLTNVTQQLAQAASETEAKDPKEPKEVKESDEESCMDSDEMVAAHVQAEAEMREKHRIAREKFQAQHAQITGLLEEAHKEAAAASHRDGSRTPRRKGREPHAVDLTKFEDPGEARAGA